MPILPVSKQKNRPKRGFMEKPKRKVKWGPKVPKNEKWLQRCDVCGYRYYSKVQKPSACPKKRWHKYFSNGRVIRQLPPSFYAERNKSKHRQRPKKRFLGII